MRRCILFSVLLVLLLVSVVIAQQVLPTAEVHCNFKGPIYICDYSPFGTYISLTIQVSNEDSESVKFYSYHYEKDDDGKEKMVKGEVFSVGNYESLTVTLRVKTGGGIMLESEHPNEKITQCISYTIIFNK